MCGEGAPCGARQRVRSWHVGGKRKCGVAGAMGASGPSGGAGSPLSPTRNGRAICDAPSGGRARRVHGDEDGPKTALAPFLVKHMLLKFTLSSSEHYSPHYSLLKARCAV